MPESPTIQGNDILDRAKKAIGKARDEELVSFTISDTGAIFPRPLINPVRELRWWRGLTPFATHPSGFIHRYWVDLIKATESLGSARITEEVIWHEVRE